MSMDNEGTISDGKTIVINIDSPFDGEMIAQKLKSEESKAFIADILSKNKMRMSDKKEVSGNQDQTDSWNLCLEINGEKVIEDCEKNMTIYENYAMKMKAYEILQNVMKIIAPGLELFMEKDSIMGYLQDCIDIASEKRDKNISTITQKNLDFIVKYCQEIVKKLNQMKIIDSTTHEVHPIS